MGGEATISQVKNFFDMSAKQMLVEWRELTEEERKFYKTEVSTTLAKEGQNDNDKSV